MPINGTSPIHRTPPNSAARWAPRSGFKRVMHPCLPGYLSTKLTSYDRPFKEHKLTMAAGWYLMLCMFHVFCVVFFDRAWNRFRHWHFLQKSAAGQQTLNYKPSAQRSNASSCHWIQTTHCMPCGPAFDFRDVQYMCLPSQRANWLLHALSFKANSIPLRIFFPPALVVYRAARSMPGPGVYVKVPKSLRLGNRL